jgi:hypothetical protein
MFRSCSVASDRPRRNRSVGHRIEKLLNAPATDILDAIESGFRAQVDIKGKLAELYLYREIEALEDEGSVTELKWSDKDGEPDFFLTYEGRRVSIQCKNVRSNETYKTGNWKGFFKVELQKTRGGTDPNTGEHTRYYRPDEFDIVAVCLFNQTSAWEFVYARATDLARHRNWPDRLEVMHPVPPQPSAPWTSSLADLLGLL